MLSRTLGWDFYKALRANDTMIVQGHQQVFSTMQQGERVIGAEGADPRSFAGGQGGPQPEDRLSERGHLHRVVADRGDQGRAQPERRQAVRAVHDLAGGADR